MAKELTIVSGGQTGVDRAALDWAIRNHIPYSGWCPRGGWAEDFPHPPGLLAYYPFLNETPSHEPGQRTEWNVRDSTATLIVVDGTAPVRSGGTQLTESFGGHFGKPMMKVILGEEEDRARLNEWLSGLQSDASLNIAGPRESESPGIYEKTLALLNSLPRESFKRAK